MTTLNQEYASITGRPERHSSVARNDQVTVDRLIQALTQQLDKAVMGVNERATAFESTVSKRIADAEKPIPLRSGNYEVGELRLVLQRLPGRHVDYKFVEIENSRGQSVRAGEWRARPDGLVEICLHNMVLPVKGTL